MSEFKNVFTRISFQILRKIRKITIKQSKVRTQDCDV
jgi:hypothetical protein